MIVTLLLQTLGYRYSKIHNTKIAAHQKHRNFQIWAYIAINRVCFELLLIKPMAKTKIHATEIRIILLINIWIDKSLSHNQLISISLSVNAN